jgi:hypothetical protein
MRASAGRRTRVRSSPSCEVLEARALLSKAIGGGFLTPTAGVVSKAQDVMSSAAATDLAKFQADLDRLEASSRVTAAAFNNLKSEGASLETDIEESPLDSQGESQDLVELQDILDQAFIDASLSGSQWNQVSQQLGEAVYGVTFTTNLANQAYTDMQTVAKEARVTGKERKQLVADEKAIDTALGPNADSVPGESTPRGPVEVYYDSQVTQFVHKR